MISGKIICGVCQWEVGQIYGTPVPPQTQKLSRKNQPALIVWDADKKVNVCSACHAELTHNSIVSTEPPSAEITDDEIEKIAEYIAQGSGYLSDFIHHKKSVKYGAIKGIEAMLDLLTNKVK